MNESQLKRDPKKIGLPPVLTLDQASHAGPCEICNNEQVLVPVPCVCCGLTVCAKCLSVDGFCQKCDDDVPARIIVQFVVTWQRVNRFVKDRKQAFALLRESKNKGYYHMDRLTGQGYITVKDRE